MTQLTVVTQNEVSIIGENPFFMNDFRENKSLKKEVVQKELQKKEFAHKTMESKNRSVNIISSSGI